MSRLIFSKRTQPFIDAYIADPSHGLLLAGPEGSGLFSTAQFLARSITAASEILVIQPEKQLIAIDDIRKLYTQTRSVREKKLVVIIDDADSMSFDAQNAFLKLLEEPTEETYFILTSHYPARLLPTILSRALKLDVCALTADEEWNLMPKEVLGDPKRLAQIRFIGGGLPAEIARLTGDEAYFAARAAIMKSAREAVEGNLYDRITLIKSLTVREDALRFCAALAKLLRVMLERENGKRLVSASEAVNVVSERLEHNGNVRAQLLYLMTKLP